MQWWLLLRMLLVVLNWLIENRKANRSISEKDQKSLAKAMGRMAKIITVAGVMGIKPEEREMNDDAAS